MSEVVAQFKLDATKALADLKALANGFTATGEAAQKVSKDLSESFNKGSNGAARLQAELAKQPKTLADLELRLVKLKELLRDDTKIGTEGFKQVTKAINDTNAAIKQANASLAETPKQTNAVIDGFKKLGAAMLAAFAVERIVAFTKEAITLAAKAEGVERAFAKIGSPELLQGLRNATNGTVTDLVLMQNVVKASNFKIPLDQLGSLLKYAQMQARATGQDVDYLVESLITGIGRKSVLVLDNLQISAVELRQTLGDVSMETATVGQVAEAVGKIASASFAKMGAQALTTADEIAQMETAYSNFILKLGAVGIGVLTPLAKAFNVISTDAQAVADLKLELGGASLLETLRNVKELEVAYEKASDAYTVFGTKSENEASSKNLKVAKELLEVAKADYELKLKLRGGGFAQDEILPSEVDLAVQAGINKLLEEEAKLRESQFRNLFVVDAELKLLNDELGLQETSLQRIKEILPLVNALEEERKTILGEETKAAKAARIANEELLKIEQKRAEEYNKVQEAEAERLRKQAEDNAKERVKIAQDMAEMLIEIEDYLATTSNEILDRDLYANQRFYESRLQQAQKGVGELALTEEESAAIFQAIQDEKNKADEEAQLAHNQRMIDINNAKLEELRKQEVESTELTESEKQEIIQASGQTLIQLIGMVSSAVQEGYQRDLDALRERLDLGLISEKEYDKEKRRLLSEQNDAAKQAAIFQAIINTALAVTSALTAGPIIGPILAVLAGVLGAAQIATIVAQAPPQFAKGGWVDESTGLITGQKHTQGGVTIEAEGGEFITNSKQAAKNRDLLTAINKGIGEKYIMDNYVAPMMNASVLNSFDTVNESAKLNGLTANLKDHNIIAAMDRNRSATVYGLKMIAEKMGNQRPPKRGGYA
jgi:hypothetical protein